MTELLTSLWMHPLAVWAGWSVLLALWLTATVALALAAWQALRPAADAETQHRVAVIALAGCVALAASAPVVLRAAAPSLRQVGASGAQTAPAVTRAPSATVIAPDGLPGSDPFHVVLPSANRFAALVGLLWAVGTLVLLVRLFGGWVVARGVRSRASRLDSEEARQRVECLSRELRVATPELLESPEVEAPVALGWKSPALIVPDDLPEQLGQDALMPLMAHELAHVKRGDYAGNLLQSVMEALLFFSPGVWWISRTIRETREYCCDDLAVACCAGDRGQYVRVLTGMAALGSRNRQRLAVAAAGPRLIVRVRRMLGGGVMERISWRRLSAVALAFVTVLVVGGPVWRVAAANAATASLVSDFEPTGVPFGYAPQQPGSPLTLAAVVPSGSDERFTATVRNNTDTPVQSITFVAVVSRRSAPGGGVWLVRSQPINIRIAPHSIVQLPTGLLSGNQLGAVGAELGNDLQVFFGLAEVTFSTGESWSVRPNPAARSAEEALALTPADVPRAIIGMTTSKEGVAICYDDHEREFSEGAVIPVRGEPGRFARCWGGAWVNYAQNEPDAQDRRSVVLEIGMLNGLAPHLRIAEGETGTVSTRDHGNYGFVPHVQGEAVTVEVFDLNRLPHRRVARIEAVVGGDVVQSKSNPEFGIRVVRVTGQ